MKIFFAILLAVALLSIAIPAFADGPTTPGNSAPGPDRYLNNPGRIQAGIVGAQNDSGAASGTFGYLGKDNSMGTEAVHCESCGSYPGPGTDGEITGLNNSSVAGNRQGNLP